MDKNTLYEKMTEMVPVESNDEDFRLLVKTQLNSYVQLLEELDEVDRPDVWTSIVARVKQLCNGLNRAVNSEYKGMRHSAYNSVKHQLDGYKKQNVEISGLAIDANIQDIHSGTVFYRMRKVALEEQKKIKRGDIFHIPLDKRGLVETQRYSVPGYPCLYLSHRVYGCWEEMNRPDFGTVMVSKFQSQADFRVLDIRMPSKMLWENNWIKCVKYFPFVIASMVQVKNNKDSYKPEYLIPQLLTEWVIAHNRELADRSDEIIGILYTSSQKNDDFDYPEESYDNLAIPVLSPLSLGKYCKRLKELFKLSKPTYYDLEVLKHGEGTNIGRFDLTAEEQREENINLSHFGCMEDYLNRAELEFVE